MSLPVLGLRTRLLSIGLLSVFALHCGTPPGPETDEGSGGLGGDSLGGTSSGGATIEGTSGGTGGDASGGTSLGGASGDAVTKLTVSTIDQVDLLFVVDNSVSMADKQVLLVQAVPKLIERLVTPDCIDLTDGTHTASDNLTCPVGSVLEIDPQSDLHIGVISSSLGGFGSAQCPSGDSVDKSRLIPQVRPATVDPSGLGFLEWSGGNADAADELSASFSGHIAAVGENGCGFEAPLEAWYRFLIDPSPPLAVVKDADGIAASTGIDAAILEQRSEFLRPDSLVVVVMLTDEDDCSGMEGGGYYDNAGYGWLVPETSRPFSTASTQCTDNPNDACCYSCLFAEAPEGCVDTCERDVAGDGLELTPPDDRANMRCHDAQRRFGLDLLYPPSRYVDGLSKKAIVDTQLTTDPEDPVLVPNPLLLGASLDEAERSARPPNQVFLAGIVGVPWQDIATPATLDDPEALEYIDAKGLREPNDDLGGQDRWALILGKPGLAATSLECQGASSPDACGEAPVPPLDPFMIRSIPPRSGTNPITGDEIVDLGADAWSPINGSEYNNSLLFIDAYPAQDDLQYACIFPLSEASFKPSCSETDSGCDCGTEPDKGRPLCKPAGSLASTPATTSQYWGKAYPAQRLLQVLQGFGDNSIVASICPKVLHLPNSPYFGYTPALNAVVERLAGTRGGVCLTPKLSWDEEDDDGTCAIVEAVATGVDCAREGRSELDEGVLQSALEYLADQGHCDGDAMPCEDFALCAITPAPAVEPCFGTTAPDDQPAGYCLIDPAEGPAAGGEGEDCSEDPETWTNCENPNSVLCPSSDGRMLRFVGEDTPVKGSVVFRACAAD